MKAAQGWAHAGELARAANRYADYLASAPANAPQRRKADKALKTLAAKLGRIEVRAVDVDHLTLDGAPLDQNSSYVTTGAHTVAGQTIDHRAVVASTSVAVGETATVSLSPPAPEPAPAPVLARPTLPILANTPAPRGGWSPAVVVAGGGVTAALLGLTIWSGLDTVSYKNKFDQDQSRENLDTGHSKQTRTNILIGATAGAAALTTLAAIVLVDWKGKEKEAPGTVQLGFGVGSAVVTGSF